VPKIGSKLTMEEKMIYNLLVLFANAAPINCHPSEESNTR